MGLTLYNHDNHLHKLGYNLVYNYGYMYVSSYNSIPISTSYFKSRWLRGTGHQRWFFMVVDHPQIPIQTPAGGQAEGGFGCVAVQMAPAWLEKSEEYMVDLWLIWMDMFYWDGIGYNG